MLYNMHHIGRETVQKTNKKLNICVLCFVIVCLFYRMYLSVVIIFIIIIVLVIVYSSFTVSSLCVSDFVSNKGCIYSKMRRTCSETFGDSHHRLLMHV